MTTQATPATELPDFPEESTPTSVTIAIPNPADLVKEQGSIVARAEALAITNDDEYTAVCAEVSGWAKFKARVESFFKPDCDSAYKLWQSLTGKRKAILDPVDQAVRIASGKVSKYEADKVAKAEAERLANEAAARKQEEDHKLAEAQALKDAGHHEASEQVLNEEVSVPAMPVAAKTLVPVVAGKTSKKTYSAKVVNLMALLKYIIEHPEDQGLVEVNQGALNKRAQYQKENFKLAGCELEKGTSQSWARK